MAKYDNVGQPPNVPALLFHITIASMNQNSAPSGETCGEGWDIIVTAKLITDTAAVSDRL